MCLIITTTDMQENKGRIGENTGDVPESSPHVVTTKKILVLEDDQLIRELLKELLSFRGYIVTAAVNGVEGLKEAQQSTPDLIISDVSMPEMNGLDFITHIKDDPILKDVPFIFLSAKSREEDLRKGLKLGADSYMFKPFSNNDLLNEIEEHIF